MLLAEGFAARYILDELGVVFDEAELDGMIKQFGTKFPKTVDFSKLARNTLEEAVSPEDDPSATLPAWLGWGTRKPFSVALLSTRS